MIPTKKPIMQLDMIKEKASNMKIYYNYIYVSPMDLKSPISFTY